MILIILLFVALSQAFTPEYILYTGKNYTGYGLIITGKEANLTTVLPLTYYSKSYCVRGRWVLYNSRDYGRQETALTSWTETLSCNPDTPWPPATAATHSVRYVGPSDTDIPSISFYSGINQEAEELTIDGPAYANLPFVPKSLFSTGFSNWTLFTGNNFDGNATCFISNAPYHSLLTVNATLANVQSVYRGCLGKIDTFFIPGAESFTENV